MFHILPDVSIIIMINHIMFHILPDVSIIIMIIISCCTYSQMYP